MILILCILYLIIQTQTDETTLVYRVGDNNRFNQIHFGRKLLSDSDYQNLPDQQDTYLTYGLGNYFESSINVLYSDFKHHYF
jgi:alpha-galactosidase